MPKRATKILFVTPPLVQLNCAYPATSQLVGYLRSQGVAAYQQDLSIELICHLLTRESLHTIFERAQARMDAGERLSKRSRLMLAHSAFSEQWVDAIRRFLQGKEQSLQIRLSDRYFWPNEAMLPKDEDMEWDYGMSGTYNRAQYLCTLWLEQLTALIQETVSPHFEMVRYGEKLCMSLSEADALWRELDTAPNLLDEWMLMLLRRRIDSIQGLTHVGLSVPFPGNLYAALRCAQMLKREYPHLHINMGGGYVNTELRQLRDERLFDYIDTLTYDDGELPMLRLMTGGERVRTITRGETLVDSAEHVPFAEIGAPVLEGLPLTEYLNTADTANPMQRLWADGRWNKLMMAHGCYWAKCAFCDTCLDYIGRYDAAPAEEIVRRMDSLREQSGESGFHFVDEAMPPKVVHGVSEELIARGRCYSWWGNIRFEKYYTAAVCQRMAEAGCIAVSGGIEVASERVLRLINKGVSVASVRDTLMHFRDAGIMVHAYLMYGFPTQTEAELMESLDTVRGLFEEGLIQSAFWHRYAMTCHSPSGRHPEQYGATWSEPSEDGSHPQFAPFANNEIGFLMQPGQADPDWSRYHRGLNLATQNYMRGVGFDMPIRKWFR